MSHTSVPRVLPSLHMSTTSDSSPSWVLWTGRLTTQKNWRCSLQRKAVRTVSWKKHNNKIWKCDTLLPTCNLLQLYPIQDFEVTLNERQQIVVIMQDFPDQVFWPGNNLSVASGQGIISVKSQSFKMLTCNFTNPASIKKLNKHFFCSNSFFLT